MTTEPSIDLIKKELVQTQPRRLIKPRQKSKPKPKPKEVQHMVVTATAAKRLTPTTENNNTKIEIEIDKDKLSLISHALKHSNNKTVVEYVTETLDGLHGRVSESIKTVQI